MTLQATQKVTRTGLTPTFSTPSGATGDSFMAGNQVFLRVKNASGSAITVTVTPPAAGGPLSLTVGPPTPVSVPATTGDVTMGPYPAYPFAGTDGSVAITYSAVTSVTTAVLDFSG